MFQFTREFIINDNIGKIGGKRFDVSADRKTLFIDNMINIRKQDVNVIYKHEFEAEAKEKVTVKAAAFADIVATDVVRLVITLGQRGKVTATYNDVWPDHSRQLFYETTGKVAAAAIDGLLDSVAHEGVISKEKFADVKKDGDDLVIEALDCYTIVKEVRIVTLPQTDPAANIGALLTGFEDWNPVLVWTRKEGTTAKVTFVEGKEGNGNTVQILKNMRLLTDANLNPYGLNMDERPLPKGQYDQYMVELVTERRHIGHDVMGSVGTSLTTLVFYVLKSAGCADDVSADFEAALEALWEKAPIAAKGAEAPKRVLAHTSDLPEEEEGGSSSAS